MNYVGRPPVPGGVILVGDTNPVGMISWFHAPPDSSYLRLNGQIVAKAAYPDLWAFAQGYLTADQVANPGLYRNIDASNFAVPKLDGLFIRAQGSFDAARTSGALGVRQDDLFKSHDHGVQATNGSFSGATGVSTGILGSGTTTATGGLETRPTNVALIPCVKALRTIVMPTPQNFDLPGRLLQRAEHVRGDFVNVAAVIPYDDTIPQIGEGFEFFSVPFIPQRPGTRLKINAIVQGGLSASTVGIAALFRNGVADSLAVNYNLPTSSGFEFQIVLAHEFTHDGTPITLSLRCGGNLGNFILNGRAGRFFGGRSNSFLRVEEYN